MMNIKHIACHMAMLNSDLDRNKESSLWRTFNMHLKSTKKFPEHSMIIIAIISDTILRINFLSASE